MTDLWSSLFAQGRNTFMLQFWMFIPNNGFVFLKKIQFFKGKYPLNWNIFIFVLEEQHIFIDN